MGLREFWIVQTWNPRKEITYSSITALMKKLTKIIKFWVTYSLVQTKQQHLCYRHYHPWQLCTMTAYELLSIYCI